MKEEEEEEIPRVYFKIWISSFHKLSSFCEFVEVPKTSLLKISILHYTLLSGPIKANWGESGPTGASLGQLGAYGLIQSH